MLLFRYRTTCQSHNTGLDRRKGTPVPHPRCSRECGGFRGNDRLHNAHNRLNPGYSHLPQGVPHPLQTGIPDNCYLENTVVPDSIEDPRVSSHRVEIYSVHASSMFKFAGPRRGRHHLFMRISMADAEDILDGKFYLRVET